MLEPDAERRIVAQITAIKQDLGGQAGAHAEAVQKLDALARAVHEEYANGPGIGPRTLINAEAVAGGWGAHLRAAFADVFGVLWGAATDDRAASGVRALWQLVLMGLLIGALYVAYDYAREEQAIRRQQAEAALLDARTPDAVIAVPGPDSLPRRPAPPPGSEAPSSLPPLAPNPAP